MQLGYWALPNHPSGAPTHRGHLVSMWDPPGLVPGAAPGTESPPPFSPATCSPAGKWDKSTEQSTVNTSTAYCGRMDTENLTRPGSWGSFPENRTSKRKWDEGIGVSRKKHSGIFWNVRVRGGGGRIRIKEANKSQLFKESPMDFII